MHKQKAKVTKLIEKTLSKRHKKEKIFRCLGGAAVGFAILFLLILFSLIFSKGYTGFLSTKINLEVDLSNQLILENSPDISNKSFSKIEEVINDVNYDALIEQAAKTRFSLLESDKKSDENYQKEIYELISESAGFELKREIKNHPDLAGGKHIFSFTASSKADMYFKHEITSTLSDVQMNFLEDLIDKKEIHSKFNTRFFKFADSREPEMAGVAASVVGSFFSMIIFLLFAFPIAAMCAFYLEEFAPKNRITDIIEISINNLAAIPSIIYGLLGLTLYIQFMHLPRSSSLVGGMTLFMLVLPVIIISTRNTIRSIPNSIRDAAAGLGASKMQIALHHLLPLSIPGIMTGTILAVSRALGETAPLLMIGMVAFIADVPQNFTDPTTALPVQIYLWSDSPESGFEEKTSAAIMILLGFLLVFNSVAIFLRKKFEKQW